MKWKLRIWEKIKVNDKVTYKEEQYIVEKIYKEDTTTYAIIRNIVSTEECSVPLYACRINEN